MSSKEGQKSTTRVDRKIGGLCPASIKLHFNEKTKHFEVQYCSTHVGHLLDTKTKNNSQKSSSKSSTETEPPKPKRKKNSSKNQTSTSEEGLQSSMEVEESSLAIDSIILSCAYGCPEMPICEHLKPFQVSDDCSGGGDHQYYGNQDQQHLLEHHQVLDHHYYQQLPSDDTSSNLPPSSSNSITPNENENLEGVVEEGVVDLTENYQPSIAINLADISQLSNFVSGTSETPFTAAPSIKIADLLRQPQLTLLFSSLVRRTNSRNFVYVQQKMQELLGTLDSLEFIHGSYAKKLPEDEG